MKFRIIILLVTLIHIHAPELVAQFSEVSEQQFNKSKSELDYKSKTKRSIQLKDFDIKEEEKKEEPPNFNLRWFDFGSKLLNVGAYILIILLIGVILFILFNNLTVADKSIEYADEPLFEEDIEDIDALAAYNAAIEQGDFRTAIRMRFILVLQYLSETKSIAWKLEKTNRDYLRELRGSKHYELFNSTSAIYDRVWYGNFEITREEFEVLNPRFDINEAVG